MDFWRIWRLINRRIYLVVGLALVAAVLVVIGIFIQNQRAGVTADARLSLQQNMPSTATTPSGDPVVVQNDLSKRISELATRLANNNNIFLEAARLLRMDEEARKKEVANILERNQYFAPYDSQIEDRVGQQVLAGEVSADEQLAKIAEQKQLIRQQEVASLAAPRDRQGAFAQSGLKLDPAEIADNLREFVDIKPVVSLLDTENNRQFDSQVQLLGRFTRDNEALLYLNMLCVAFLDDYAVNSQGTTRIGIARLIKQRDAMEADRQRAIGKMSAFKRRGEFASLIGQDTTGQTFQQLEQRISELKANRDAAEETWKNAVQYAAQVKPTITNSLPADENIEYKRAKADYEKLAIEVKRLAATKGEKDPELQTARAALNTAAAQVKANRKSFTQSQLNPNYQTAKATLAQALGQFRASQAALRAPEAQFKKIQQRLSQQPALQAEYSKIAREIDGFDKNLARINQELTGYNMENLQSSRSGTIQITRAYVLPSKNTITNGIKLLVYATVLALILGIALVIGMDALDNSVRTKKDAEEIFGLPVAGEIPAQLPDPRRAPRVTYLDPLSPISEAYRLLRTDILFTQVEHTFHSLLIATVKPGQGATTTATNLAITLAQAGKKVILVDADLRHPSLHTVFALPNESGLTTLLAGASVGIDEVLQRTEIESMLVLTSGPLPLNPSELLSSQQMRELHERLKAVADVVIFDAPSAITFSETTILASFVDATLLVIRTGDVPRGAVDQVKAMLTKARANLIGVVLNAAPSDTVDSVHYHNQYYPRLKATPGVFATDSRPSYTALEDDEPIERLAAERASVVDSEDDDEEEDAPIDFLAGAPTPSLRNPGAGERPTVSTPNVMVPSDLPEASGPVIEPPRSVFVELPHPTTAPRAPEVSRAPEAPAPLKTNWGTSPMAVPSEPLPTPEPEVRGVRSDSDDEISFDFEDEEIESDLDDDDDYFGDDYDDDYEDELVLASSKKKRSGLGGILGWFKRGRS